MPSQMTYIKALKPKHRESSKVPALLKFPIVGLGQETIRNRGLKSF